ncbi:MAG: hypothetical protein IT369_01090 [Candidatus Latescibacteria bacterium]|nr:hypothetical protein [Candidatus Latescibacterota bacterium]
MRQLRVDYETRLVEEVVLRAVAGHPDEGEFRRVRDQLYELGEADERDRAFCTFHGQWFERLGMCQPVEEALAERPLVLAQVRRCAVVRARNKKEEGAELFVSPDPATGRAIGLQLRPESLLVPDQLLGFLRHEVLHLADMLDPAFGYEPALKIPEEGMAHRMVQDRYRVLWDTTIDGRLTREGRAPDRVRQRRLLDFARAFPMLGAGAEEHFARFFDGTDLTHAQLVACARDPVQALGLPQLVDRRCPLCTFPSYSFEPDPESLSPVLVRRIQEHFPAWRPAQGICRQCADLYRGRQTAAVPATA